MPTHASRRDFLLFITGTAGATLVAACRPRRSGESVSAVPTLVPDGFRPTPSGTAGGSDDDSRTQPFDFTATDPDHSALIVNREPLITAVDRFYVQSWNLLPDAIDATGWTLTIDGLVDRPLTLTYDDVLAFEPVEVMRTLECIGNPVGGNLIGNQTWTGVRLKPLLDETGIQPEAIRAKFTAADNYMTSIDLEWILQEDTLLVYAMDGQPLTHEHGYPLRIMMPGLYGQKMPKWIQRIEFSPERYQGYWEHYGWSDVCEVKTNSQIILPENLSTVTGTFALQGWAYGGKRRIVAVEVSVDGGEWQPCELLEGPSPLVWTMWWTAWTPERTGAFRVAVRATDETGFVQERPGELLESAYPDGTDAIHSLAYNARPPENS
jgi:DMSO/TMAO reductase YedYZ molybdopterin-dependent catalytic subunit